MPISTSNLSNTTAIAPNLTHTIIRNEQTLEDIEPHFEVEVIDDSIFKEIGDLIEQIRSHRREEREAKKMIEKLKKSIESSQEMLDKAETKRDALLLREQKMLALLEEDKLRTSKSLEYWKNYGFNVEEISNGHYQFIYTKLPESYRARGIHEGVVELKLDSMKQLQILSVNPDSLMTQEQLQNLNSTLPQTCLDKDSGSVDFKLAMICIRRELLKPTQNNQNGRVEDS